MSANLSQSLPGQSPNGEGAGEGQETVVEPVTRPGMETRPGIQGEKLKLIGFFKLVKQHDGLAYCTQ